jgi:hypothetical protein
MLTPFDWLRRCAGGAELLATLELLRADYLVTPSESPQAIDRGPAPAVDSLANAPNDASSTVSRRPLKIAAAPPQAALVGPCLRCWFYAATPATGERGLCPACQLILQRTGALSEISHRVVCVWGYVNRLPDLIRNSAVYEDGRIAGVYLHSDHEFLLLVRRRELHSWLQDILLYDGLEMTGSLQIFPTVGVYGQTNMGELLCQVVHNQTRFPRDQLRVRFFASARHVLEVHKYDKQGVINFEMSEFLRLLESAAVFRSVLKPDEQETLRKVLAITNPQEAQFYWGRFLGMLSPQARDLLAAWKMRYWSEPQVNLFYELVDYVAFRNAD